MAEPRAAPHERALVTPEGVELRLRVAALGDRVGALLIDLCIVIGVLIALTILVLMVLIALDVPERAEPAAIVWLLGFFLVRNFYFTYFESGPRAATLGKRIMRLRVASRSGGPLTADAVIARNAMRELELYLPVSFLFANASDADALIALAGVIWTGVFLFLPMFNRDRLRAGDIIAGTWVVQAPRRALLPDLAETQGARALAFTDAQLSAYGVKELQVLENVLRNDQPEVDAAVAERIRGKIGWKRIDGEADRDFLNAYYAGLRRRLEQRLLFGVRKADKHDKR